VHKEVLNQIECLFVGQLSAKHERDAIKGWILAKSEAAAATTEALAQLPYLAPGDFYCWSPQWLQLFVKTRCYPKQTFDASATPELDDEQPETPALPGMDLDALRAVLAVSDPGDPRSVSPDLTTGMCLDRPGPDLTRDRELDSLRAERSEGAAELMRLHADHATVTAAYQALRRQNNELRQRVGELIGFHSQMTELLSRWDLVSLRALIEQTDGALFVPVTDFKLERSPHSNVGFRTFPPRTGGPRLALVPPASELPADPVGPTGATGGAGPQGLGRCALAIVGALNQHGPMSRLRLAVLTGYQHDGGGFRNSLSELRSAGLITPGSVTIEPTERCILIDGPRPARGKALVDLWSAQLGACARGCLATLLGPHLRKGEIFIVTRKWVAEHTMGSDGKPYAADGGGFRNALSELRRPGIITSDGPFVTINPTIVADLTAR
jgi:hypothetical protein